MLKNIAFLIICTLGTPSLFAASDQEIIEYFHQKTQKLKEARKSPQDLLGEIYFYFATTDYEVIPEDLQNILSEVRQLSLDYESKKLIPLPLENIPQGFSLSEHQTNIVTVPLFERALLRYFLGQEYFSFEEVNPNVFEYLKEKMHLSSSNLKTKFLIFLQDLYAQQEIMKVVFQEYLDRRKKDFVEKYNSFQVSIQYTQFRKKLDKEKELELFVFYQNLMPQIDDLTAFSLFYFDDPSLTKKTRHAFLLSLQSRLNLLVLFTLLAGSLTNEEKGNLHHSPLYNYVFNQKNVLEMNISVDFALLENVGGEPEITAQKKLLQEIKILKTELEIMEALYWPGLRASLIRKLLFLDPWFDVTADESQK